MRVVLVRAGVGAEWHGVCWKETLLTATWGGPEMLGAFPVGRARDRGWKCVLPAGQSRAEFRVQV